MKAKRLFWIPVESKRQSEIREGAFKMDESRLKSQGKRLKGLREQAQLPLVEVAKVNNISVSYLNHVENGEKAASPDVLEKLARFYNVSVDSIVYGHERPKNEQTLWHELLEKIPSHLKALPEYKIIEELFAHRDFELHQDDIEQLLALIRYIKKVRSRRKEG